MLHIKRLKETGNVIHTSEIISKSPDGFQCDTLILQLTPASDETSWLALLDSRQAHYKQIELTEEIGIENSR